MIEEDIGNIDGLSEIDKLIHIVEYYFPGKAEAFRAMLGAIASLAVAGTRKTIPLWLYGEAGVAKSTIALFLNGLNLADWAGIDAPYALNISNFSAKSFRSAHVRDGAVDLLDRLGEGRSRVLITSELNVLWGKPQAQLQEICSQIVKVVDDDNSMSYATAGMISGPSDSTTANNFIWIGATISIPPKVSSLFSVYLGPRLYFYNLSEPTIPAQAMADELQRMATEDRDYWPKILIVQQALAAYIQTVPLLPNSVHWNKVNDQGIAILSNVVMILRMLRAGLPVERKRGKMIMGKPVLEAPKRCMEIAIALARGQAILRQVNSIGLQDIPIVCKIMLDTAGASYPERAAIFRLMLENDGVITVKKLVEDTDYPQMTLIEEIEKLSHIGLINYFGDTVSFTEEYSELALSLQPYLLQPLIQEQGRNE